jgi:septal ring factor EnvC (AmiA/AmiB activator)
MYKELEQHEDQQYILNRDKTDFELKLKEKMKQLDAVEKTHLQSLRDAQENEKRLQSTLDEKEASIAQWRKENDILKSQLDAAVSINGKLHEENARLEAECKKRE